jgi:hypothetical protein
VALEPDVDRNALRERLIDLWLTRGEGRIAPTLDAILNADDLLVVDLRCPTCGGSGKSDPAPGFVLDICLVCEGVGRRDVVVVDAEAWRLLVALLRKANATRPGTRILAVGPWLDACLANPVLAAEVADDPPGR